MTSNGRRAIVVGHGEFAVGVVSAVVQMTGRDDVFATLSNRGLGAEEIERQLRECVDETDARVIFTDLPAGSATIAAMRLLRDRSDIALVTGTNLAALLDFMFQTDAAPDAAARHAAERGRAALVVAGAPRAR
jgi:PTS system N-acetylgalactosamine-specific IIA component